MTKQERLLAYVEGAARPIEHATNIPRSAEVPASGFYLPLVQRLMQLRQSRPDGCIFALTAVSPGEGVSYVTQSLAWELSRNTGEQILISSMASLSEVTLSHLRGTDVHDSAREQKMWRLADVRSGRRPMPVNLDRETLHSLRRRFGYVLVDCPALRDSAATLSMGKMLDGVILVVAAGQTKRNQIEQAQKMLESSACEVIGLVLNKRTYPIPGFISRIL
jgi:Mrp family chromosome partitioning ATPase